MTERPNALGLATKLLLKRGFKYEGEIRPRRTVHGIILKQHIQPFVLIARTGNFGETEEPLISVHRILIETEFTHGRPIILAHIPWREEIKFYVFDPWKIKKEGEIVRGANYVSIFFPFKIGWRWTPSKDLSKFWEEIKASRYNEVGLDRFMRV